MAMDFGIIGKRIRKMRKEKGLTQENLAEKMDVSVAFLSKIETGKMHVNLQRLSQICNILGVTEGEILNGTSIDSNEYLIPEFYDLLKNCSPENQKLIYDIAKLISERK